MQSNCIYGRFFPLVSCGDPYILTNTLFLVELRKSVAMTSAVLPMTSRMTITRYHAAPTASPHPTSSSPETTGTAGKNSTGILYRKKFKMLQLPLATKGRGKALDLLDPCIGVVITV